MTEWDTPIEDIIQIIEIGDGIVVITKDGTTFTNATYFIKTS